MCAGSIAGSVIKGSGANWLRLFLNWAAEPSDAPGRPAVKPGIRGAADCLATEDNSPHNAEPPMGPDRVFGSVRLGVTENVSTGGIGRAEVRTRALEL